MQRLGCSLKEIDKNSALTMGTIDFHCVFFWQAHGDVGIFFFQNLPKGGGMLSDKQMQQLDSNKDKEIICDFCLISLCSVPIIL